jgi:hypothetical protein
MTAVRVLGYKSGGPGKISGTTKKKVVGLERGPLSLVSTTEELLDRKVSIPPRGTIYPQKLAITSPTRGGRSVGIVRSRTQTIEFNFFLLLKSPCWTISHKNNIQGKLHVYIA